jgi:predicted HicB family RNase H-like nuclease
MVVSKDSARVMVTMSKELKEELEMEAEKESRSLSNYIVTIIQARNKQ